MLAFSVERRPRRLLVVLNRFISREPAEFVTQEKEVLMRLSRGLTFMFWLWSSAVISSTAGGIVVSQPGVAYAGSCTPLAASSSNQQSSAGFGSFATMEKSFTDARAAEGCSTPLDLTANQGIFATTWNGYSPQQQMFVLYNAERQDRGLGTLALDSTLMSQIDANHSHEMNQYGYFAHDSPISGNTFGRLLVNPAINNGGWSSIGENIAGNSSAAAAVFEYMYDDGNSNPSWGHRHSILGYNGSSSFGQFNWVGIGVSTSSRFGLLFTSDFLQATNYNPPAAADMSAPTMSRPYTTGSPGGTVTATATNVADSGAGRGAAGLTKVVFYSGSPVDGSGNSNTVAGTQNETTWTANLTQPVGTEVHAVAVDGSGNYTDCTAGGACVSSVASSGPTAARVTHLAVFRQGAQTVFRWSVSPNHRIAGFNLYAGRQRLNGRLIPSMQRTSFRYSTHWSGPGRFRLEVVMSNGEAVRIAAH